VCARELGEMRACLGECVSARVSVCVCARTQLSATEIVHFRISSGWLAESNQPGDAHGDGAPWENREDVEG
jgi:hypothetical protein